ncbi:MAG: hypothetical protein ACT4N2_02365 [Hyphomicrobium sp.]
MPQPMQPHEQTGFDADAEYRAIEAALLETPRGRWFLAEHGRRARRLDSAALDEAVQRLNSSLRQPPALLGALQREILALKDTLAESRLDVLARTGATGDAEPSTPQAILKAAEDLHEMAWSLQANDIDPQGCETIARNASRIYALSQVQAAEGARALKYADSLEVATNRLNALLETIGHEMQADGEADRAQPSAPVIAIS